MSSFSSTLADQRRTAFLATQGYQVVRFWNHEVLTGIDPVLEWIASILIDPLPSRAMARS